MRKRKAKSSKEKKTRRLHNVKTARKKILAPVQNDAALREAEQKFRAVFDTAVDGIIMINDRGSIEMFNTAAANVFGFSPEEVIGKNVNLLMPEPYRKEHDAYVKNYLSTGVKKIIGIGREVAGKRKDGTVFPVDLAVSEVRLGKRRMFTGIVRDITERKRLEEQFFQMQKMEAVGQLAGGVAHDFSNFLQGIIGFIGRIRRSIPADDPAMELVEEVMKAVDRTRNLTRQLLAFSRRQPIQPKIFQVNDLILNLEKMLHRLIGEDVELVIRHGKNTGLVKADPVQIEQVLLNLAVNARDAMPKGGRLVIETKNRRLDKQYAEGRFEVMPGEYVVICVSDTGTGMSEEVKENIFEPFFTTKEVGKGTGLGLATVFGIVKQHGGHISVYSEVGKGTTFRIHLPRADEVESASAVEASLAPSLMKGKETVLVVEDDSVVRKFVSGTLRDLGYTVLAAGHPDEAFKLVKERRSGNVDLLLTDVIMPKMSGKELSEKIKDIEPHIKVIFMSGYTDDFLGHHGILEESLHFLEKPFTEEALAQKIRDVLEK